MCFLNIHSHDSNDPIIEIPLDSQMVGSLIIKKMIIIARIVAGNAFELDAKPTDQSYSSSLNSPSLQEVNFLSLSTVSLSINLFQSLLLIFLYISLIYKFTNYLSY